jgi:ankyrin repeat protein
MGLPPELGAIAAVALLMLLGALLFAAVRKRAGAAGVIERVVQPDRIQLVRDDSLSWSDGRRLREIARQLRALGFRLGGTYRIEGMEGVQLAGILHPQQGIGVAVYERSGVGIWCDAVAEFEDGESLCISNARHHREMDSGSGHELIHRRRAKVAELVERLRGKIGGRALRRLDESRFTRLVEDAHARAVARPESSTPEPVAAPGGRQLGMGTPEPDAAAEAVCAPLFDAIEAGDPERVGTLARSLPELERRNARGRTPLMRAVESGRWDLVAPLVEAGADLDARAAGHTGPEFPERVSPLLLAIETGNAEMVQDLLRAGAEPRGPATLPALHSAAVQGDADVVYVLVEAGAELNRPAGEEGRTPLIYAAEEGFLDVVEVLMEAGADVDAADDQGDTAILAAARRSRHAVVEFLAPRVKGRQLKKARRILGEGEAGRAVEDDPRVRRLATAADPAEPEWEAAGRREEGSANREGSRRQGGRVAPLMLAARGGHLEVVRLLLEAGADPDRPDGSGQSPLELAREQGHRELVSILTEDR